MDEHNGSLIEVNTLRKLRQAATETELDAFAWFWDILLPCVSSGIFWASHKNTSIISGQMKEQAQLLDIVNVSDEVLALFLFENGREKWMAQWENKNKGASAVEAHCKSNDEDANWTEDCTKSQWRELQEHVENNRKQDVDHRAEWAMLDRIQRGNT